MIWMLSSRLLSLAARWVIRRSPPVVPASPDDPDATPPPSAARNFLRLTSFL